jgi:hypothetical protein
MAFEKQPSRVHIDMQSHWDELYVSISVREGHSPPRYLMISGIYNIMWDRIFNVISKSPLLTEDDILLIINELEDKPYRKELSALLIEMLNEKNKPDQI